MVSSEEHPPITLTERGQWLHGGQPILPRVAALFARHIVPKPDGRYIIELGDDTEPIQVADTAFFVEGMDLDEIEDGRLAGVQLRLSDGQEEPLNPSSLMISEESVLYARITRHGLSVPCRFPPSLYHRLALHVEENPGGGFVLPLAGQRWPLAPYKPAPKPA